MRHCLACLNRLPLTTGIPSDGRPLCQECMHPKLDDSDTMQGAVERSAGRRHGVAALVAEVKNATQNSASDYDCVIAVSGGKDSLWLAQVCLEGQLNPLAVTYAPLKRSPSGLFALDALRQLGVDHLDVSPNPVLSRRLVLQGLRSGGNPSVAFHLGLRVAPFRVAAALRIGAVVYAEGVPSPHLTPAKHELSDAWLRQHGATSGMTFADLLHDDPSIQAARYWHSLPDPSEASRVRLLFLSEYLEHDEIATAESAMTYWRNQPDAPPDGSLRRQSGGVLGRNIDDDIIELNEWMKYLKFGWHPLLHQLSLQMRSNATSRLEAIGLFETRAGGLPLNLAEKVSAELGIPNEQLLDIVSEWLNLDLWSQRNGVWQMPCDWMNLDWSALSPLPAT